MAKSNEKGQCPKCDSENLEYGAIMQYGESIYYPFTCNDCGCEGKEFYSLEFDEIVSDNEEE